MNAMVTRTAHRFTVVANPLILAAVLWLPQAAMCQDVGFVAVVKGQEFAQTSADIVSIGEWRTWHETGEVQNEGEHPDPLHIFESFAIGTSADAIVSGTTTLPGGEVLNMEVDFLGDEDDPEIGIENGYNSPLELDSARPDGSYTVQLVTRNQGTLPIPLSLAGSTYPPVPHVTNFTALQSADASADITIQWAAMGGTANDFIQVTVSQLGGEDDGFILWESPMPGDASALDGTATGVSIPAGALQAGTDYQAEVLFVKTTEVKMPPASPALAVAGYYKLTGFLIRTTAPAGQPLGAEFLRATPLGTWSGVPVDSALAFHFSHPMSPSHISIDWTANGAPLSGDSFAYQWTQDNTVLLCKYSTDLPANSEIGWTLNLGGFQDARGFALTGTPSGIFQTGLDEASTPPDVGFISILKTRYFVQTGELPAATGIYEASVEVETHAAHRLTFASLTSLANGRSGPLYADPWDSTEYEAPGEYGSQADLYRFYPNGNHRFDLNGLADGSVSITLDLGATDQYPAAPTVTNLAALQVVDPDAPATVTWDALPGWNNDPVTFGPGDGLIEFEILDRRDREVVWVDVFELENGTQYDIPAGTLKPGKTYEARLYFLRITDFDETSYPGALAVAAFESQTAFAIRTTGQPLLPAITLQHLGGTARITANGGDPDESYLLETSSDMQRWTTLDVHWNDHASIYEYDDFDASYFRARFYRMGEYDFEQPATAPISIQGTVWTNTSRSTPAAGATVGTSLDGRTTTTDLQGRFFLITDTPSQNGMANYTITITHGAQTNQLGPWHWGDQPREQVFEMN